MTLSLSLTRVLTGLIVAALPMLAQAQVGLRPQTWRIANADGGSDSVSGQVWYPTTARSQPQQFGPFRFQAALGAPLPATPRPLVLISHGTGGVELGHSWLAQALAEAGYLVVTLRHPRDNYQDRSGVARPDYFSERPRQISRVLDQVLADPQLGPLVDRQRIAAIGHSAGGHSVLALAGGHPDQRPVVQHCGPGGPGALEDAELCRLGAAGLAAGRAAAAAAATTTTARGPSAQPARPDLPELPDVRDVRVRAVVADSPMGLGLQRASLAGMTVPVLIQSGAQDTVLNPRWHAQALCAALPRARCVTSPQAGHFALFQAGTGSLASAAGDPASDPPGFDRAAWQQQQWPLLRDFLADALR